MKEEPWKTKLKQNNINLPLSDEDLSDFIAGLSDEQTKIMVEVVEPYLFKPEAEKQDS